MSYFLLGRLFVRSLTDRFRLFIMQPNGRFIELFLMDIIILNFINDELKSGDKKLPCQDSSIKQAIEKLIQSFENHWSVNWYCKKELFSNNVFRFFCPRLNFLSLFDIKTISIRKFKAQF